MAKPDYESIEKRLNEPVPGPRNFLEKMTDIYFDNKQDIRSLLDRCRQLEDILRWLINLECGIGESGCTPEDGEYDEALKQARQALGEE